jgi:hypothetical protein
VIITLFQVAYLAMTAYVFVFCMKKTFKSASEDSSTLNVASSIFATLVVTILWPILVVIAGIKKASKI